MSNTSAKNKMEILNTNQKMVLIILHCLTYQMVSVQPQVVVGFNLHSFYLTCGSGWSWLFLYSLVCQVIFFFLFQHPTSLYLLFFGIFFFTLYFYLYSALFTHYPHSVNPFKTIVQKTQTDWTLCLWKLVYNKISSSLSQQTDAFTIVRLVWCIYFRFW